MGPRAGPIFFLSQANPPKSSRLGRTISILITLGFATWLFRCYRLFNFHELYPLMIGAADMAFPRLNAASYWLVPPVAVMLLISTFSPQLGGWDTGWTAYPPLSVLNDSGQVLFNLAVITFGVVSIVGGINFLVTIIYMRAEGMTWWRLPIFVWGVFAASLISFFFTQAFAASLLMVLLDRVADTSFFRASEGGSALLYEHFFWFYSHPAVYVMVLPGFGIALEVMTHFSRKPLFAYRWAVGGLLGIVALSGTTPPPHPTPPPRPVPRPLASGTRPRGPWVRARP